MKRHVYAFKCDNCAGSIYQFEEPVDVREKCGLLMTLIYWLISMFSDGRGDALLCETCYSKMIYGDALTPDKS